MTFLQTMDFAMDLYSKGKSPILVDKSGVVLHGQETLDMGIDPKGMPRAPRRRHNLRRMEGQSLVTNT
jgi:hypothetical protein